MVAALPLWVLCGEPSPRISTTEGTEAHRRGRVNAGGLQEARPDFGMNAHGGINNLSGNPIEFFCGFHLLGELPSESMLPVP